MPLRAGKLFISHSDLKQHMSLTQDTKLVFEGKEDGVEIHVFASDENEHEWLTESNSNHCLKREKVNLSPKTIINSDVKGFVNQIIKQLEKQANKNSL